MGKLIDGTWQRTGFDVDGDGRFCRPDSVFRDWVRADGSSGIRPEAGRFHLYVAWACPWAHRALMMRALKRLEDAITVSIVHPHMGPDGWYFDADEPACTADTVNGVHFLHELYQRVDPRCSARVTVPVLWDKQESTILNNESRDIIRMLDHEFAGVADDGVDLCPPELEDRVDATILEIYRPINNGVYRAGFARSQEAYDEAVSELFDALDHWERVLANQRYVCGERLTEADLCMFATLYRFDPVYHYHFKCSRRRIAEYEHLSAYLRDIYQTPGIRGTVNLGQTKRHYYCSHPGINPDQIVPSTPPRDLDAPHGRDEL